MRKSDLDKPTLAQTIATLRAQNSWQIGTLSYTRQSLTILFAWLLWGDFAWQMRERAVGPVTQLLLKHLHASDFFNGLLVSSLPSAIALILGPVISTISDRYRSRLGRRIPFLLAPTPFAALALIGLSFVPALESYVGRTGNLHILGQTLGPQNASLAAFAVLWTIFEIAAVTTTSMFYALVNDVVPHELVGRSFGIFRAVSLLAGILFNHYVIGHAEQHYQAIFLTVGIIYGVGVTMMCVRVKEGQYPPPEPLNKQGKSDPFTSIGSYFRATFSLPYYRWVYAATTLAMLSPNAVNAFSVFYAKSIGLNMSQYGDYLALTYIISFCLSFLLGYLADRFHPLRLTIISVALYAVAMLIGSFIARTPQTFAIAFVAHGVLSGCLFTAIVPTYQRLFPKAKFGEFYSAANLLTGIGSIIVAPSVGKMLDASGHVYRYTFLVSGSVAVLGTISLLIVYGKFRQLGGPYTYIAPGEEEPAEPRAAGWEERDEARGDERVER